MNYGFLPPERYGEYDTFIRNASCGDCLQSTAWAEVKRGWEHRVLVCRKPDGEIAAGILVLIRRMPILPLSLLYAPRGPVFGSKPDYCRLPHLAEGIRRLAKETGAFVFKSDPAIPAEDRAFEVRALSAGFSIRDTGMGFDGIQPRFVYKLPLEGRNCAELMASFHPKTRYNIRLAGRRGVTIRLGGTDDLPAFYRILQQTAQRDGFVIRESSYYAHMMRILGDLGGERDGLRLYLAERDNTLLAGAIAVKFGGQVTYLYGASADFGREHMPAYLLQWEMIRWAVESGCRVYDLRGVSGDLCPENPLYGLYRFKKGFSGELTEYIGEMEIVFNRPVNALFTLFRKLRRGD